MYHHGQIIRLGLLAYIYFGAGVLFSATGSAFIICQYDPFVSFFRRSGSVNILIIGVCFLVIGMFIGRPYCRYLCPYSILLRLTSKGAKWHVNITPSECINCHLCADSCPFGAIKKPTLTQPKDRKEGKKAFTFIVILLPLLITLGALLGVRAGTPLSHVNPRVRLAERIWMEDTKIVGDTTESSDAFRGTGSPKDGALCRCNQDQWKICCWRRSIRWVCGISYRIETDSAFSQAQADGL